MTSLLVGGMPNDLRTRDIPMQLQDGPRAYLAGYQIEHGHLGAEPPLPPGGVADDYDQDQPAPPSGPVMGVDSIENGDAVVVAKVMTPPEAEPVQTVEGAESQ